MRQALDDVVVAADLTTLQYTALTVLERHPGITSAELARNSFVRAQTMAQMTTQLEGRDLIKRDRDPQSRRQFKLQLTDNGRDVLVALRDEVAGVERDMLAGLTSAEAQQLRAALRACRVALGGRQPH